MLRGNYGNYKSETLDLFKITECRIYTLESQDAEAGMVTLTLVQAIEGSRIAALPGTFTRRSLSAKLSAQIRNSIFYCVATALSKWSIQG
jgi:hypothetical protein